MIILRLKVNKSPCACWERSEERPGNSWAPHTCEAYRKSRRRRRRVRSGEEHEDLLFSSNFTPADIRGVNISTHHKKPPLYPSHMCALLGSCRLSGDGPDLRTGLWGCFQIEIKKCRYAYTVQYVLQVTTHSSCTGVPLVAFSFCWKSNFMWVNLYKTNRANTESFSAMEMLMLL